MCVFVCVHILVCVCVCVCLFGAVCSNKDSDPEKYALKLRLHEEGVSHCEFTDDEDKVISSAGMEVKVCLYFVHMFNGWCRM